MLLSARVGAQSARSSGRPEYGLLKEIGIAGDTGWDYLTVDSEARRRASVLWRMVLTLLSSI
jgi:hypothetical protein